MIVPTAHTLTLREPYLYLLQGLPAGIGRRDEVATNLHAIVASNRARSRLKRLFGANDLKGIIDAFVARPDHDTDGTGLHVGHQVLEVVLLRVVPEVSLELFALWQAHLDSDKFHASLLEPADEFADEASLDAIGPDHNECLFNVGIRHA